VSDKLADMLRVEFGSAFVDLRSSLASNPSGPHGAFGPLPAANVEALVLHHTAGTYDATWESVAAGHVNTRAFAGIGYHIGVQNGRVSYLGDIGTARAHVAGQNHRFVGVCVAGNYETDTPRPADLALLSRLGPVLRRYFGRPVPWKGHRDLAATACPGKALYAKMGTLDAGSIPPDDFPVESLRRAAIAWHEESGIRVNPEAALFKAAEARGLHVVTNEATYGPERVPFVVAESYGTDRRKVALYWRNGRVGEVAL
jgi:hypothetical protein